MNTISGWIDNKGNFITIDGYTSHDDWALKNGFRMITLFDRNWMRIISIGNTLYVATILDKYLTCAQRKELIDMAIINGRFDEIIFEDCQNNNIVIWYKEQFTIHHGEFT